MLVTGEQARAMGYNPDSMVSIGGKYEIGGQSGSLGQLNSFLNEQTDKYINDLLASVNGDKDFAIKQLTQQHDQAVGSDDTATAQFLESVASALETKVGRIPYDYQVAVERTTGSQKTALQRLMEDEQVWMKEKAITDKEARVGQQESLAQRGILSGTRDEAMGLAGEEVKTMEQKLQDQLDTYKRAKGRSTEDINLNTTQTLQDLQTGARRGVQDIQTQTKFGKEAATRAADAKAKELERQRALQKLQNPSASVMLNYGN